MFIVSIINCSIHMYGIIVSLYDHSKSLLSTTTKYNSVAEFVPASESIVRS